MYDCRQTPDAFASGRFGARDCPLWFDGTGRPRRPVSTRWPRAGLSPAVPCCRTPRSPPAPRRRLRPSPASPPLVERGLGQASPMWRSTPRRTWCASTALQATTPASVALSHHQSLSDSGEPRPTPRATDAAIDPTRRIPFTKTNQRAPREIPYFSEIAAVSY
jgi:hypothetical protein